VAKLVKHRGGILAARHHRGAGVVLLPRKTKRMLRKPTMLETRRSCVRMLEIRALLDVRLDDPA